LTTGLADRLPSKPTPKTSISLPLAAAGRELMIMLSAARPLSTIT
jgi:hypothetical protein